MWKEMESRLTRRRSLTLEQRGGKSGRRNVRRRDEDVWLEAGVYGGGTDGDDNIRIGILRFGGLDLVCLIKD
jgi:hypothetical protein